MRKLILASLTISSSLAAQSSVARPRTAALRGSLEHRLAQLIDAPPFDRPTWSERCYSVDTLAPGVCDSAFSAMDAVADSVRARGIRRITGKLVGDGSYFEPTLIHYGWNAWDLTWWYAAPVSGLGFHDNSVDFHIAPAPAADAPPVITWSPDLGLITFENRARTVPADSTTTIGDNFFRSGGGWSIRAEGTVALGRKPWVESVAVPDPNLYAARALATSL